MKKKISTLKSEEKLVKRKRKQNERDARLSKQGYKKLLYIYANLKKNMKILREIKAIKYKQIKFLETKKYNI